MSVCSSHRQRIIVAGLHGIALILLVLQLYVRTLPATAGALPAATEAESAWWGLWPIRYLPAAVVTGALFVWLFCLVGCWLVILSSGRANKRESSPALLTTEPSLPRKPSAARLWLVVLAMLLTGAFFLFPIAHTRWGDAYLLSKSISWPDPALRLTYSWQAPLDVFIHSQLWLWGHVRFGWEEATPVYRLLSPLAGLVYLGATLALGRHEQLWPAWLVFALLTTLGLVQLFFGYVENYSLAAAGLLVYLYFGLETLQGRQTLWPAAIALALTNALHPSTVVLAPSLFYLGWCKVGRSRERNKSPWPVVYSIVIPMLFVALGTILLMERGGHGLVALLTTDRPGGGDARPFVPLWNVQTRWEQYTMFSWLHLRDLLNQQGLVAPVVWPAIIWLSIVEYRSARIDRAQAESHLEPSARSARATADLLYTRYTAQARLFLAIAALSYLLFICVWNPDYGGQRDWDLFSLSALPATLWLAALLTRALQYRRYLLAGAAPLILLQAWHTGSWVYQNTLPWLWP